MRSSSHHSDEVDLNQSGDLIHRSVVVTVSSYYGAVANSATVARYRCRRCTCNYDEERPGRPAALTQDRLLVGNSRVAEKRIFRPRSQCESTPRSVRCARDDKTRCRDVNFWDDRHP
jgi:hypothetical protein